jgi:hypothetical protein
MFRRILKWFGRGIAVTEAEQYPLTHEDLEGITQYLRVEQQYHRAIQLKPSPTPEEFVEFTIEVNKTFKEILADRICPDKIEFLWLDRPDYLRPESPNFTGMMIYATRNKEYAE